MTMPHERTPARSTKTTTTTLGELIAAAYAVSEGRGRERAERAAQLLTHSSRKRSWSRRLRFVR
jgi:hypothetical protein